MAKDDFASRGIKGIRYERSTTPSNPVQDCAIIAKIVMVGLQQFVLCDHVTSNKLVHKIYRQIYYSIIYENLWRKIVSLKEIVVFRQDFKQAI